ncbi:hypothetical protein G6F46_000565 [Rhizopus delemar]|uniref:Phytocyanin domain-containing protein n=3 Tax=Rhizopus TaxID=4842 RepID=I1CGC8_RHIO9|nr:hypothetical protein RO3G_12219 [Rhizopus delemar RA 99-880]KAG1464268.1 hypothetical protein G6F55_001893 [Rhizopus delemar]KAG1547954.1 hypothetical protein G6F51_003948 [Rhizopus arrhizus]KAG1501314.1 hypothetical protein G6F54_003119 [Rhizopus delemar]KAG1514962.1 hypothetical protein G6F53_003273 [Rhizopus delemar]|eukprot:EIE87508.1 hypothetical protein RO3G_12219 [Rhizopus delemar RA 99-880]
MKTVIVFGILASVSYALINDVDEDCIVMTPIGNTIVRAGEKMKIQWSNAHTDMFDAIYLVQSDGDQNPIVIATDLPTNQNRITVNLPKNLIPSNAYYMTLGKPPYHCHSGNLRVLAARKGVTTELNNERVNDQLRPKGYAKEEDDARQLIYNMALIIGLLGAVFIFVYNSSY